MMSTRQDIQHQKWKDQLPTPLPSRRKSAIEVEQSSAQTQLATTATTAFSSQPITSPPKPERQDVPRQATTVPAAQVKKKLGRPRKLPSAPKPQQSQQGHIVTDLSAVQAALIAEAARRKQKIPKFANAFSTTPIGKQQSQSTAAGSKYGGPVTQPDAPGNNQSYQAEPQGRYHTDPRSQGDAQPSDTPTPYSGVAGNGIDAAAVAERIGRSLVFGNFLSHAQTPHTMAAINSQTSYLSRPASHFVPGATLHPHRPAIQHQNQYPYHGHAYDPSAPQNSMATFPFDFTFDGTEDSMTVDPELLTISNPLNKVNSIQIQDEKRCVSEMQQSLLKDLMAAQRRRNPESAKAMPYRSTAAAMSASREGGRVIKLSVKARENAMSGGQGRMGFPNTGFDPALSFDAGGLDPFADFVDGDVDVDVVMQDAPVQDTSKEAAKQAKAKATNTQDKKQGKAKDNNTAPPQQTRHQAIVQDIDISPDLLPHPRPQPHPHPTLHPSHTLVTSRPRSTTHLPSSLPSLSPNTTRWWSLARKTFTSYEPRTGERRDRVVLRTGKHNWASAEYCFNYALAQVADSWLRWGSVWDLDLAGWCARAIRERQEGFVGKTVGRVEGADIEMVDGQVAESVPRYGFGALKDGDGKFVQKTAWDVLMDEMVVRRREFRERRRDRLDDCWDVARYAVTERQVRRYWRGGYDEDENVDDSQLRMDQNDIVQGHDYYEEDDEYARHARLEARLRLQLDGKGEVESHWMTRDAIEELTRGEEEFRSRPVDLEYVETEDVRFQEVDGIRWKTRITMRFAFFHLSKTRSPKIMEEAMN